MQKRFMTVLFVVMAMAALTVGAFAQTGAPVDLSSQVAAGQASMLSYLGIIFAAAAAITAAFTGAKVFMKWSSARAKSS